MPTLADLIPQTAQRFKAAGIALGQGTQNYTDEAAWLQGLLFLSIRAASKY